MIDPENQASRVGDQTFDHAKPSGAKVAHVLATRHSAPDKSRAFEWLRALATSEGAPKEAGVVLDSWADLAFSALADQECATVVQAEAIRDALSVCRSVRTGPDRRIVRGGCVMYMQTAEWCAWIDSEVAPKLEALLAGVTSASSSDAPDAVEDAAWPPLDVAPWEFSIAHSDGKRNWVPCGDDERYKADPHYVVRLRVPHSKACGPVDGATSWQQGGVTLSARQLAIALEFAAPDFLADEDQRGTRVGVAWAPAGAVEDDGVAEPAGLRIWLTEHPEHGSALLVDAWAQVTTTTSCLPVQGASPDGGGKTLLTVETRHPADYVLINEADGTRWRAQLDGTWKAESGGARLGDGQMSTTSCQPPGESAQPLAQQLEVVVLPAGLPRSDAEFWLQRRAQIIGACREAGFMIVSTANDVRLERLGGQAD